MFAVAIEQTNQKQSSTTTKYCPNSNTNDKRAFVDQLRSNSRALTQSMRSKPKKSN
jgi:hypothetical protein